MSTTIYSLNNIKAQVIWPSAFKIKIVDKKKKLVTEHNYANAGFFTQLGDKTTYPVGHLVVNGEIISNAATSPSWINLTKKSLTTLIVHDDNQLEIKRVFDISKEPNVKYSISGIPILSNGRSVISSYSDEGYFGDELYNTWHIFIGIRGKNIVLIGAKCETWEMPYLMESLGIDNSIKLDGGGSFILHSGDLTVATDENRRIHNIITW